MMVYDDLAAQGCACGALAAMADNQIIELNAALPDGAKISPLTLQDEEGRRVYERSLRFVLLLALRKLYPGQRVRIEYSAGRGIYVRLPGRVCDRSMLNTLEQTMRAITAADLPFSHEVWPLEKVRAWFAADGQQDKLDLLHYRSAPTMTMYHMQWQDTELWEYFYGAMAPSSGAVAVFGLALQDEGFILYMADPDHPERPAPAAERPRLLNVFRQSAEWCRILGVENAADLSRMLETKKLRNFIRVNEALHDSAIADIARQITDRNRRVVLVAGPSSSGKTTFAGRLAVHLQVLGRHAYRLSMDDYYLNRVDIPLEADGTRDLEAITTLDLPLLRRHLAALIAGACVDVPRYDFHTGTRMAEAVPLQLGPDDVVIIEGIHGLNPTVYEGLPQEAIHRVFVSALTCLNLDDHNRIRTTDVRLLRRIVRDSQFRGTPPSQTLDMWASVRRGEEKWIFPYQEQADSLFNTALQYELPVLAHYAYPLLLKMRPEDPCWAVASRLRKMLNYMPEVDEALFAEIPPLSLLREFIGGCTIEEA